MAESTQPLTIRIGGQTVTASLDEWGDAMRQVTARRIADRDAWEAERRTSGQVWIAEYHRYHSPETEECFSLDAAKRFLVGGEDYGSLSADGVRCPDGTFLPFDLDWFDLASA